MRNEVHLKDEILEQAWKAKEQLMRDCGGDLGKLAVLLRQSQQERKHSTVDLLNHKATSSRAKP